MANKPSTDELGELFGTVVETLRQVTTIQEVQGADGKMVTVIPPPAYIAAAITLLKNNNITADPVTNTGLAKLREQMEKRRASRTQRPSATTIQDQRVLEVVDGLLEQWNSGDGSIQ